MNQPLMLDTNVIIDYSRRLPVAVTYVRALEVSPLLSAVVVGELYAGVRDGEERKSLDELVDSLEVIPLTADIAALGGLYRRQYGPSHNVGFNDAMIAATAHAHRATLVTLNRRHFPMLNDILTPYPS